MNCRVQQLSCSHLRRDAKEKPVKKPGRCAFTALRLRLYRDLVLDDACALSRVTTRSPRPRILFGDQFFGLCSPDSRFCPRGILSPDWPDSPGENLMTFSTPACLHQRITSTDAGGSVKTRSAGMNAECCEDLVHGACNYRWINRPKATPAEPPSPAQAGLRAAAASPPCKVLHQQM